MKLFRHIVLPAVRVVADVLLSDFQQTPSSRQIGDGRQRSPARVLLAVFLNGSRKIATNEVMQQHTMARNIREDAQLRL